MVSQYGDSSAQVFGVLALLVSCAALGRYGAKKLKQSPVLGELAIGIVVGAILYHFGNPALIIIRHSEVVQKVAECAPGESKDGALTVGAALEREGLSTEIAQRVERVLQRRDFSTYLMLARSVHIFAAFGIVMLLFMVGLEVSIKELNAVGGSASVVAATGVCVTFGLAFITTLLLWPQKGLMPPLFAGAALCATSIGITARILKDMKRTGMRESRIVLGAAVLDDILGLIVLAVVTTVAINGAVGVGRVFLILFKTGLFLGAVIIFGTIFDEKTVRFLARLELGNIKLLYPFVLLMVLAWLADRIGLAAVIGAFAAGVIVKEESFGVIGPELVSEQSVESLHASLEEILAPVFFVLVGLKMDITALADVKTLMAGLLLAAAAVAGKLASSIGVPGGADKLIIGIGMLPRVEVALIVASMGRSLGVLDDSLYSVIIVVVLLTVLMTPALLKWAIEKKERSGIRI